MKFQIQKEWANLVIILLPIAYLVYIWKSLPEQVPMHWDLEGKVDRYGSKNELMLISLLIPILTYVIMVAIPFIDPKDKIKNMGKKYDQLKMFLVAFMTVLSLFIIYSSSTETVVGIKFVFILIGLLYIILGNYFKTIKPNYFMGVRTPWTLEDEQVWRSTHTMAGKLWFGGGILVIVSYLALDNELAFYSFIAITALITLIPVIYSYVNFKNRKL